MKNFRLWISFFKKDFLIAISYKLSFFNSFLVIIANVIVFFYFSKIVDVNQGNNLYIETSSYYTFLLIGIAISDFSLLLIGKISQEIRNYQLTGVIEHMFNNAFSDLNVLIASYAYPIFLGFFRISLYFIFGYIIFDIELFKISNLDLLVLSVILNSFALVGIGLIAGAYTFIFKMGNPVIAIYGFMAASIGGIFFPISVYPEFIKSVSDLLPVYHTLEIIRELERPILWSDISFNLIWLCILSFSYLVIGYILIRYSIYISRKTGSILHY